MRRLLPLLALVFFNCIGCSSHPGMNPDPVDVTGAVKLKGKPVTDVVLNLQPTGRGHPVVATVTDGKFKAHVTPGKYNYYITEGQSAVAYNAIPKEYRTLSEANVDTREEILVDAETSNIDVELD